MLGKPFNLAVFCGLVSEGVNTVSEGVIAVSEGVFSVSEGVSSGSVHSTFANSISYNMLCWWIPLLVLLLVWLPPLDKTYAFFIVDVPSAIRETFSSDDASSLAKDVDDILRAQHEDWSPESEDFHPTSPPPPPPPSVLPPPTPHKTYCSLLRSRTSRLLLTLLALPFAKPTTASTPPSPSPILQAISTAPSIAKSPFTKARFTPEGLPWRVRRRYERIASKIEEKLGLSFLGLSGLLTSSHRPKTSRTPKTSTNDDALISAFVHQFNPAVEAMEWLISANMDKVLMQRRPNGSPPTKPTVSDDCEESVSVHLKKCKSALYAPQAGFLGAIETVFNSLSFDC
jgi:hypothetical protein